MTGGNSIGPSRAKGPHEVRRGGLYTSPKKGLYTSPKDGNSNCRQQGILVVANQTTMRAELTLFMKSTPIVDVPKEIERPIRFGLRLTELLGLLSAFSYSRGWLCPLSFRLGGLSTAQATLSSTHRLLFIRLVM